MSVREICHGCNRPRDPGSPFDTDKHLCESCIKINHPLHYNSSPAQCECGRQIECIDVTRHMNFNIGNVVKYLWRAGLKGSLSVDLKKAQWYLNDAVEQLSKKP